MDRKYMWMWEWWRHVSERREWGCFIGDWVWSMSSGDRERRLDRCWFESCVTILITKFFIVCRITLWNHEKRWSIVAIIVSLCSCVTTSFLKENSISSLNAVFFLSNVLRKSSWEKDDTMVDASFVTEEVTEVALDPYAYCLGDNFSLYCR